MNERVIRSGFDPCSPGYRSAGWQVWDLLYGLIVFRSLFSWIPLCRGIAATRFMLPDLMFRSLFSWIPLCREVVDDVKARWD